MFSVRYVFINNTGKAFIKSIKNTWSWVDKSEKWYGDKAVDLETGINKAQKRPEN